MIAKFTFNYNGAFEKKENAVFQQGSLGVDSYQVYAPFPTTTQVFIKTKRNGDLEFSLWKQLDYNSTIGGWLKTATADELLVNGELKVVFKFGNLVSQETSLWVREGTLVVPQMTTYEALRDYVENQEIRINQIIDGSTSLAFDNTGTDLDSIYIEEAIKEVNDKVNTNTQDIVEINLELDGIDQEIIGAKSRLDDLEEFEATVPIVYETIANVDLVRDDVTDLETFANTTVPATYETKVDANVERVRITNLENTRETKADATSKLAEAKAYADSVVDSVYDYKGSVAFESLPTSGQKVGDTYNITNNFTLGGNDYLAGTDVAWNGTGWNALSSKTPNASEIKISAIGGLDATHTQGALEELQTEKLGVDKVKTTFSATPLDTNVISEKLAKDTLDLKVPKADIINDLTTGGATKVLSAEQGKLLQDTKEALANKAIDFSVVNDTKYPTTKAVSERLLNLPIAELNNHTLREVFEGGNLWQPPITLQNLLLVGGVYVEQGQTNVVRPYKTGVTIIGNLYYIRTELKRSIGGLNNIYIGGNNSPTVNAIANTWTLLKNQLTPIDITSTSFYSHDVTPNSGETFEYRHTYVINQTSLGISALTVSQMDYWFSVYQTLLISDTNAIFSMFASKTLEAWLTPTLTGATATYLKYRKDTLGSVIVEGNITVTTAGTNFTLPTGYRPLFAYTVGILTFNTDGTVVSSATGTQTLSVRFTGGA